MWYKLKKKKDMELTINFIKESFRKYNAKYFNNQLVEPRFKISNTKRTLGSFCEHVSMDLKDLSFFVPFFTITVSEYYDRDAKQYDTTIIHEMIHLCLAQNGIREVESHGPEFMKIANRINEDGWDITPRTSALKWNLNPKNVKSYNIFLIECGTNNGDYFMFACMTKQINFFKRKLSDKNYVFFITSDREFNDLPTCRTMIRGAYITKEKYKELYNRYF